MTWKSETIGDLSGTYQAGSIGQLIDKSKSIVLSNIKNSAIDKLIEKLPLQLALQESKDDIKLSRHKAMEFKDSQWHGKTDHMITWVNSRHDLRSDPLT